MSILLALLLSFQILTIYCDNSTCLGPSLCQGSSYNISCCCDNHTSCTSSSYDRIENVAEGVWMVLTHSVAAANTSPPDNR